VARYLLEGEKDRIEAPLCIGGIVVVVDEIVLVAMAGTEETVGAEVCATSVV